MFSTWSTQKLTAIVFALLVCAPAIVFGQESESAVSASALDTAATMEAAAAEESKNKEKVPTRIIKSMQPVDGYLPVEMFAAMEAGEIKVELIPRDATRANIFVTNLRDEALAVQMPQAFAGVPVLAQFGGGGGGFGGGGQGGGGRGGGQGGQGGGQGIGGGTGGGQGGGGQGGGGLGGGGGGGGGLGGGVFNVPPGKRGRIQVSTVCLEFDKIDPRPSMKYEIKPITELSSDPVVAEICKMLANGEISQEVAQAAAWHKTDNKSWDELVNHDRVRLSNGYYEKFFTPEQVFWAQGVVAEGQQRAQAAIQAASQPNQSWRTDDPRK